jgi:hypothetical protein
LSEAGREVSPTKLRRPAAGDDVGVEHAESPADEKQRRGRGRIDSRPAVPAEQLRGQVGDAGVEELEFPRRVLLWDLRLQRLERQSALQLIRRTEQVGECGVVARVLPQAAAPARSACTARSIASVS